jgi:hypothetical protein
VTAQTRFPRRLLAAAATIIALAVLAPAVAASPRSGALHVTKNCDQYTGAAGDFCTIQSSNLNAIKPGSRVYYLQAADFNSLTLDSDIVLDEVGYSAAYGHVTLDLVTGQGTVTLSGGTGVLRGFEATVAVSPTGNNNFDWDGTYAITPHS